MAFKKFWFQLHWILGITAGLILMVVGVTGGMLSFEHEIVRALNKDLMTVQVPAQQAPMTPEALMRQIQQDYPDKKVNGITVRTTVGDAWSINFADEKRRFGENRYINQYTGEVRWQDETAHDFLHMVEDLHRRLMQGQTGKQIVGASTIALIILTLSGLYLRWPNTVRSVKVWLTFNTKTTGRSFLSALHAVAGTWVLIFFLLASVTGLFWSYDWYRAGMFKVMNVEQPVRAGPPAQGGNPLRGKEMGNRDIDPAVELAQREAKFAQFSQAWQLFNTEMAQLGYSRVSANLPQGKGQNWTFNYFDVEPAHSRARNTMVIDLAAEQIVKHDRYLDKKLNEQIMSSMLPLHSGEFFGTPFRTLMMLASLSMPLFGITGILLYVDRRRSQRLKQQAHQQLATTYDLDTADWVVLHASQTGRAEKLAIQTAVALQQSGQKVALLDLGSIKPQALARVKKAFIVTSTYGDGGAPDTARSFETLLAKTDVDLQQLSYAILALGDRNYTNFCGFGIKLASWLEQQHAQALAPITLVSQMSDADLSAWYQLIAQHNGDLSAFNANEFATWTLTSAQVLNAGSQGFPTYEVKLTAADAQSMQWQAGDLAEIAIEHQGNKVYRTYSIANLPSDGYVSLLVRQVKDAQQQLGIGSGYLTNQLQVGDGISMTIRQNPSFHLDTNQPVIFVGNGTGLAGLKAHLANRIALGQYQNWLVFGERNQQHDYYYQAQLENWLQAQHLAKLSLAFSRDASAQAKYVQDALQRAQTELKDWLDKGAYIVVCGSVDGMAQAVDQLLQATLGADGYADFIAQGRYLRDVY